MKVKSRRTLMDFHGPVENVVRIPYAPEPTNEEREECKKKAEALAPVPHRAAHAVR